GRRAASSDPSRLGLAWFLAPPHQWHGRTIPGGRKTADNPDNAYRIMGIDGRSSYVIRGSSPLGRPSSLLFQAVAEIHRFPIVGELTNHDLVTDGDRFTITVGPAPSPGPNHIRTTPEVIALVVRDSLGDWA